MLPPDLAEQVDQLAEEVHTLREENRVSANDNRVLREGVAELTGVVARLSAAGHGAAGAGGEVPENEFGGIEEFVEWWVNVFGWRIRQGWHWCEQWWDHPEAILRLESLWRSFEVARLQDTGMSMWLPENDREMHMLLGPEGPLGSCHIEEPDRAAHHEKSQVPQLKPAPEGWWD